TAAVDRVAAALLGRHVVWGAADDARAGDARGLRVCAQLGQPEIHDLHEIAAAAERLEDHILWLEIAMHDAKLVGFTQRRERLTQHLHDACEGQWSFFVSNA